MTYFANLPDEENKMNLITQREKEIEDVEKGCGKINYISKEGEEYCCEMFDLCLICKAKLQILKKILSEEKEFVKRLKEELKTDLTGCFTTQKQCDEWNKDTNEIIDNLSIHNEPDEISDSGSSNSIGNNTKEDDKYSFNEKSILCKNCGKPKSEHFDYDDYLYCDKLFSNFQKFEPQDLDIQTNCPLGETAPDFISQGENNVK